jgi:hypothetical protein
MSQPTFYLRTSEIIGVIEEWLSRGHSYYWATSADMLLFNIRTHGVEGWIEFGLFGRILDGAETVKMRSDANAGFTYFRSEAKRRKVAR